MKKISYGVAILATIAGLAGASAFKPHQTSAAKSHAPSPAKSRPIGYYWFNLAETYHDNESTEVEITKLEDEYPGETFTSDSTSGDILFEEGFSTEEWGPYPDAKIWEVN